MVTGLSGTLLWFSLWTAGGPAPAKAPVAPAPAAATVVHTAQAPQHVIADGKGTATLLLGVPEGSMTLLTFLPGAAVPEHVHAQSGEFLYLLEGSMEVTIQGKTTVVTAGDAIHIPAGAVHSARVLGRFDQARAVQMYVGPGPEERFRNGEKLR